MRRLISRAATVIIADRDVKNGHALAAELGPAATFVETDVVDEASVQRAVTTAGALHGAGTSRWAVWGADEPKPQPATSPARAAVSDAYVARRSTTI